MTVDEENSTTCKTKMSWKNDVVEQKTGTTWVVARQVRTFNVNQSLVAKSSSTVNKGPALLPVASCFTVTDAGPRVSTFQID